MVVFPYSITPGGIWNDPHGHAQTRQAQVRYVNYLYRGKIYWTPAITIPAREHISVSHDGTILRVRCGNTISRTGQVPILSTPAAARIVASLDTPESGALPASLPELLAAPGVSYNLIYPPNGSWHTASPSALAGALAGTGGTGALIGAGYVGVGIPAVVPPVATPEPSTWALLLTGLGALCIWRRPRRRSWRDS